MKYLIAFIFTTFNTTAFAQKDIQSYLQAHHYSFSLDQGFNKKTTDTLKRKLSRYKLLLQAEGGSHFLDFYKKIPLVWLKFLSENFGLRYFFLESGHSSDILLNRYLQTGDTSCIYPVSKFFWKSLYAYNAGLPAERKISFFGIDFEGAKTYVKALQLLLPPDTPPQAITPFVQLIKNANNTLTDCNYIIDMNNQLKKALARYQQVFTEYFGSNYADFERIVLNNGNCKDAFNNRNKNMAVNFLSFDKKRNQSIYYGELGEAHTVMVNKNTASIINQSQAFANKVCVVNLYCYNCSTPKEEPSNWPLKKIEKDIIAYFLPFCNADFTLFDLSDNPELTKKYAAYGQFLIIAKNQN